MAPAKTVKQWTVKGNVNGFDELKLDTAAFPECGENEVLVKLGAASLNYRDLMIPKAGLSLQKVMQYEEKLTYKSLGHLPFPNQSSSSRMLRWRR